MSINAPVLRPKWQFPLLLFIVSRLFIIAVIQTGLLLFPAVPDTRVTDPFPKYLFLNGLVKWDGGWYVSIAESGYSQIPPYKSQTNLAFMPFYPLVIKIVRVIIPHTFFAGLIVSHIALFFAIYWLFKILVIYYGRVVAIKSLLLLLFSPFSFYFSTIYPEALFLMGVAGMFYFALKKHWLVAAIFSSITTITREMGIVVFFTLVILYFQSIDFQLSRAKFVSLLKISAGVSGLIVYLLYLYIEFNDPLIFIRSHLSPGWLPQFGLSFFTEAVKALAGLPSILSVPTALTYLFHPLTGMVFFLILIIGRKALEKTHFLWALFTTLMMFANWRIMGRLLIVIFPVYVAIVILLRNKYWYWSFFLLSTLLLVFFSLMFSHGYWIA